MVLAVQKETQARRSRIIIVGDLSAEGQTRPIHAVAAVICHFKFLHLLQLHNLTSIIYLNLGGDGDIVDLLVAIAIGRAEAIL